MTVAADHTVQVVTPTYNNLDELRKCVQSLLAQSITPQTIYVCIDGSTDGSIEYVEAIQAAGPPDVVGLVHPQNQNRGRPATRNLALAHLESEYVWFVDSDMVLEPDALEQHLALVLERPCVSQGQVIYQNARSSPWAGYLDTRAYHRKQDREVVPFTWYSAANSMVRTEDAIAIDGFDARFSGYGGEDFDFAWRLSLRTGKPIINNRRSRALTVEDKSIEEALLQFEEYGAGNLHLLESLHPDMPKTFELQRLGSSVLADRLFALALSRPVESLADIMIRYAPTRLRNRLLNYKVVNAVWKGYRSTMDVVQAT